MLKTPRLQNQPSSLLSKASWSSQVLRCPHRGVKPPPLPAQLPLQLVRAVDCLLWEPFLDCTLIPISHFLMAVYSICADPLYRKGIGGWRRAARRWDTLQTRKWGNERQSRLLVQMDQAFRPFTCWTGQPTCQITPAEA